MKHILRSAQSTEGRRMAGARALWVANGMKREQMGKPIIAIVNSFTQFVPGHVHLHQIGQEIKQEIEKLGCFAAEFNTIAIDDGIAMGHDGMLYSLPSRDIIADSVEYMVNAHKADAMICISNCDKITPGMLMASMRLNIPTIFVSGGPMEAGNWKNRHVDLIDAMVQSADIRPRRSRPRTFSMPIVRLLLGHVYRQLHELLKRSFGYGTPWQRNRAFYPPSTQRIVHAGSRKNCRKCL